MSRSELAYTELGVRFGLKFLCGKSLPLRLQATVEDVIMLVILSVILEI